MPDYPTLSINPSSIKYTPEDSTIKSDFEAGYVQTRQRHTRRRMTFPIEYELIHDADKDLLEAFDITVSGGTLSFNWTDPLTSTVYIVRFEKSPEYDFVTYTYWKTSFVLVEV